MSLEQPYTATTHTELREVARACRGAVLTIGNFDGVHHGHQVILNEVRAAAARLKTQSVALTFEPHPVSFFGRSDKAFRLSTAQQKLTLLKHYGADIPIIVTFDSSLAQLEPEQFVRELLFESFQPRQIVVGYDFNFGRKRAGGPPLLRQLCNETGVELVVQAPIKVGETVVSSTRIRKAVRAGDMTEVRQLLRRPFAVIGRVAQGAGRGRKLGFPTANVEPYQDDDPVLPDRGVYVTLLETENAIWKAITNIGVRPTFAETALVIESFVLDERASEDLDLYGQEVGLHLLERLRGERKFESPKALVAQITADIAACRNILEAESGDDLVRQVDRSALRSLRNFGELQ